MKAIKICLVLTLASCAIAQQSGGPAAARQRTTKNEQRATIHLPSSKVILQPVPGNPQRTGSFTARAVVSPDQRYVAFLQDGYGSQDTALKQSIAVLDVAANKIAQFPDDRLRSNLPQTYFEGLAFSLDGKRLFASIASNTDPLGKKKNGIGNGIAVYAFDNGQVAPQAFWPIPPQQLAAGKKASHVAESDIPEGTQVPFPAGLTTTKAGDREVLLVSDNYSDDVLMLDAANGSIVKRFDLSTTEWVPGSFPYTVVANKEGTRAWVSLWSASEVAELDLANGTVARHIALKKPASPTAAGSHPTALLLSKDERTLYVALANADAVAMINVASSAAPPSYISTALPGQQPGAYPTALAENASGSLLFVANASSDAVAVIERGHESRVSGFIPTEWYPTALAVVGNDLIVAAAKATGTGPNSGRAPIANRASLKEHAYIPTLLNSSIARIPIPQATANLKQLTQQVMESNLMSGRAGQIRVAGKMCGEGQKGCPIKHVLYIIKENRTYDQILGDIGFGNGDPSLTMYGAEVTPNEHAMAKQFGLVDNFYDSGEVSGNGHVWSDAAITSDYTERTWQINYRGQRTYDYQGVVANEVPLLQNQADPNEPATGYIWSNAARHGLTYRNYSEFIPTSWCDSPPDSWGGAPRPEDNCPPGKYLKKGDPVPAELQYKGDPATDEFPWAVPLVAHNMATKADLRDHFSPRYGDFRLDYPDQYRANTFLNEFDAWVADRKAGRDTMPQMITMALPNDHTTGVAPGKGTPDSLVADNDLALGRIVEAISHSPYWDDTAIFVLEDDAQDGVDHVDAHRSVALVLSKYAPKTGTVDSHFYTTVNLVRTMEVLLGLPPMNNNDAHAAVMAPLFAGDGAQEAFNADKRNLENGRIYKTNPQRAPGAAASLKLDFSHADAANTAVLNKILWRAAKGKIRMPKAKHTVFPASIADDDE